MLAVSTQRSNNNSSFDCGKNGDIHMEISCVAANNINNDCSAGFSRDDVVDFPSDFSATGNLLDSIDFDDLFAGINHGHGPGNAEDELPDLEIDPQELLAEFSGLSGGGDGGEDSFSCGNYDINYSNYAMIGGGGRGGCNYDIINDHNDNNNSNEFNNHDGNYVMNYAITINVGNSGGEGEDKVSSSATEKCKQDLEAAEIESKKTELELISSPANNSDTTTTNNNNRVDRGGKKLSPKGKNNNANNSLSNIGGGSSSTHGKRKTKVDWTPELHRRFVQAVEQLGVDKAVPSRILELMDIDCLTRHNVASHLQKYRSHRRHLLAKEAEAASWTHKRQIYGVAVAPSAVAPVAGTSTGKAGGRTASHSHPWNGATMGFPHPTMPPQPMHHHHPNHHLSFRPLHVWGHPTHHQIETRHHHQSMMHMWPKHPPPPPPPPPHHAFWHSHHQRRFAASPAVPSIIPPPPHPATMYSHNHKRHQDTPAANPPLDFHPTKESVDAAIGDVLCKPWLPLPLGLKPPSVDSVLVELQRQGIPKIPPLSTSTAPTTDHLESS